MFNLQKRLTNSSSTAGSILYNHIVKYATPASISYAWSFGSLLGFYFVVQVITGILLTSYYNSNTTEAFTSVVEMMSQTKYGALIRYMHANGSSMLFTLLYCHIARGLYFRSYLFSKRWAWITGLIILLLMMATAFIGYVLPWGQMSFWGVTVITNLLTVIPVLGTEIHVWVMAGYSITPTTLARFYALHIIFPLLITALICLHIFVVHKAGSTSGVQIKENDKAGFHPYFSVKDLYGVFVSLIFYGFLVFFEPNLLGHPDNYIQANPMVTPAHIVPEWYFTPFYAILRAFPNKTAGVIAMGLSLLVLGFIFFINNLSIISLKKYITTSTRAQQYANINIEALNSNINNFHKFFFWFFVFSFISLIYIGGQPAEEPYVFLSRLFTFFYFFYFFFIVPFLPIVDFLILDKDYIKNRLLSNFKKF